MFYFVHRVDKNPGDYWSSPRHYYNFPDNKTVDILDIDSLRQIPEGSNCIIGGGGLIKQIFLPSLDILNKKKCRMIYWGIGERLKQNLQTGYISQTMKTNVRPEFFNATRHLASMRSLEPGVEWIPCSSCNHPIFDSRLSSVSGESNNIKVFQHKKVEIPNSEGFELAINDPMTLEESVSFIKSASILITNSYHGMYWAYLLGVPTVCIPFSTGHYSFNGKINYCEPSNVIDTVIKLQKEIADQGHNKHKDSKERVINHRLRSQSFFYKAMRFAK